jgi:hypothetical protein
VTFVTHAGCYRPVSAVSVEAAGQIEERQACPVGRFRKATVRSDKAL